MMVLAIGVELATDVAAQGLQNSDAGEEYPSAFRCAAWVSISAAVETAGILRSDFGTVLAEGGAPRAASMTPKAGKTIPKKAGRALDRRHQEEAAN